MSRKRFLLILILLVASLWGASGAVLPALGRFLVEEGPPERADVIVVLAGSFPDRVMEAVALYREGMATRILLSRGPEAPALRRLRSLGVQVPDGAELARSVAEQLGIPSRALSEVGGRARSTVPEAEEIVGRLLADRVQTVLLVTSRYHSRRACLIFRRLAGDRIRFISAPSRFDSFDPDSWWQDRAEVRRLVFEYQKLLLYAVWDRWWMQPLTREGQRAREGAGQEGGAGRRRANDT